MELFLDNNNSDCLFLELLVDYLQIPKQKVQLIYLSKFALTLLNNK